MQRCWDAFFLDCPVLKIGGNETRWHETHRDLQNCRESENASVGAKNGQSGVQSDVTKTR